MTVCNKFQPTILEGQLCYTLNIAKLRENPGILTKSGKQNGLFLLLDPKPYHLNRVDESIESSEVYDQNFKVFIHTLAQYKTFGPGSAAMSTLKKMTGTKSFKQLPGFQRKCLVHNREECQTQKYLDQVQTECNCMPWAFQNNQVKNEIQNKLLNPSQLPN